MYYLSGDRLRQVYLERGLDHRGPVRLLRQRLADHIRSGPMDPPEAGQASPKTGFENNTGATVTPSVPSGSHGGSGEEAVLMLVELLRASPPLCSEQPELFMGLFIRLDAVHDLRLVDDRTFIIRILPLVSGSLLKFLGDSLRVSSDWAECKSRLPRGVLPPLCSRQDDSRFSSV